MMSLQILRKGGVVQAQMPIKCAKHPRSYGRLLFCAFLLLVRIL